MTRAKIRALRAVRAGGCERRYGARGNTMHGAAPVLLHKLAAEGLIRDGATWPTPRRRVSSLILTDSGHAALVASAQIDRVETSAIAEANQACLKLLISAFERAEHRRAKIDGQNEADKQERLDHERALNRENESRRETLEARTSASKIAQQSDERRIALQSE